MRQIALLALIVCLPACAQDTYQAERESMVRNQIEARGISDPAVLRAMRTTPRHEFVPVELRGSAYQDTPLPIGYGQTISQPYIVAFMTDKLDLNATHKVLEIGTGSGYQAAVLSPLARHIYTIEIVAKLAASAKKILAKYDNITVRHSDGYKGWPEEAPFDRIILTAAPPEIPQALLEQLKQGGKLLAPVGGSVLTQELVLVTKEEDGKFLEQSLLPVRFVPMVKGKE